MPGPLILRESAHKGRKAKLMIFTIKLRFVPSPERRFHGKVEEATARAILESNAPDNHLVIGTWLVFHKKYWRLVGIS
jgi:hypothetical protein